jgi:hypothetical protein
LENTIPVLAAAASIVALMTEGRPLVCPVEETDFYEEKLAQKVAKSNANRSN